MSRGCPVVTATTVGAPPRTPRGAVPASAPALVRRVAGAPGAPLNAVVVGPGGTGKTVLLEAVARAYADAGVEVRRDLATVPDPAAALLLDDVHRLDPPGLDRLCAYADDPRARLVVAHRPWPRPSRLPHPAGRLVVVVGHLTREAVAARDHRPARGDPTRRAGRRGPRAVGRPADPRRDRHAGAARHRPRSTSATSTRSGGPDLITVSVALAERLRHQVDALDRGRAGAAGGDGRRGRARQRGPGRAAGRAGGGAERHRRGGPGRPACSPSAGGADPVRPVSLFLRLTPVLRRARAAAHRSPASSSTAAVRCSPRGASCSGRARSGSRIAAVLRAAAARRSTPPRSWPPTCCADAVAAGRRPREVAGRRARALALAGDLDEALRVGDTVAADPAAPGPRGRARRPRRPRSPTAGLLARSADLYRGLGPAAAVLAVPGLVVTGGLDEARAVLAAADGSTGVPACATAPRRCSPAACWPPSTASAPAALSQLARAAVMLEPVATTTLLPDTPAALTAVVAVAVRGAVGRGRGRAATRPGAPARRPRGTGRGTGCCTAGS